MSQTLTDRVEAIKNTPGTGELVQVAEINAAFDKFDNHFVPAAKMIRNATQSIPNSVDTAVDFNVTDFDSYAGRTEGAMVDLTNNKITIKKAGLYLISASLLWAGAAGGYRTVEIAINSVNTKISQAHPSSAFPITSEVSDTFLLAVNDVVTMVARHTQGAALNIDPSGISDSIALSVIWAGAAVEV